MSNSTSPETLSRRNRQPSTSTSSLTSTLALSSLTSGSTSPTSMDTSDANDNGTSWRVQTEISKLKCSGKVYELFKPERIGSLYYQVMMNSDRLQELAQHWISSYQQQPHLAMNLFLQFILDIMGFQNVRIDDFIKKDIEPDYKSLIKHLEGKCTKLHEEFQWVLNLRTNFSKNFFRVVQLFLHELIRDCHFAEILYEFKFFSTVSYFLKDAAESNFRVIKYNTVVIAAILCTEYNNVIHNIGNKNNDSGSTFDNQDAMDVVTEDNEAKLNTLNNTNEFFWYIQAKNCDIDDDKYKKMRVIIAKEIENRLKLNMISTFRNSKFILVLRKLLADSYSAVRVLAVSCCTILFSIDHYLAALLSDGMKDDRNKLLADMEKRMCDVNNKVQAAAFRFYTICIKTYPSCVKRLVQMYILKSLLSKCPNVARESGLFFTAYVRTGDYNYVASIKLLIRTSEYPEFAGKYGLIIDGVIDHFDELKDLDALVELLVSDLDVFTNEEYIKLVETFYHVVHVLVKGRSEICRGKPRNADECDKNNICVAKVVFSNMIKFLEVCEGIEKGLEFFFKTFEVLNFDEDKFKVYKSEVRVILAKMLTVMENSKNPKLEKLMFQILEKISTSMYNPLKNNAIFIIEHYFFELTDRYIKNIEQIDQNLDPEDIPLIYLQEVERDTRILACALKHYNFVKYLKWNQIYENWTISRRSESMKCNQMKICCHYLVWKVNILFDSSILEQVDNVKQMVNMYFNTCMILMKSASSKIKGTVLQCIADLATGYIIVDKVEANERLKSLDIEFIEENEVVLKDFVHKCCFESTEATLSARRDYLGDYFRLILQGSVDLQYFPHILAHYVNFEKSYKDIFNAALGSIGKRGHKPLSAVVLHTLLRIYSGESDTVTKGKLFATSILKPLPKNVYPLMIEMAINYVKHNQEKTTFVKCLEPLISKLSVNDRKNTVTFIKETLEKNLLGEANIRDFVSYIQGIKGTADDADSNSSSDEDENDIQSSDDEKDIEVTEEFDDITLE